MSLREVVKQTHSSEIYAKMSGNGMSMSRSYTHYEIYLLTFVFAVVSTRSASMIDAKKIAKIADMKVGVESEPIFQPLFGSELEADQGADLHNDEAQLHPVQHRPVKEVVAQDPSVGNAVVHVACNSGTLLIMYSSSDNFRPAGLAIQHQLT